jgi:hypothetical protein
MTNYKCKKGDVIAIRMIRSCHSIGMERKEWSDWHLGRAHKVNRKGIIEQFSIGNESIFRSIDRNVFLATIADSAKREAATRLLASNGSEPFEDMETLKSAILSA